MGLTDQVGGDDVTDWIDDNLFDPLGIATATHDVDASGVFNGGSQIDMTAQDCDAEVRSALVAALTP